MPCLKLGDLSSERLERNLEMSLWKRWHSTLISCTMKKLLANPTRPSQVNTIITRMNLIPSRIQQVLVDPGSVTEGGFPLSVRKGSETFCQTISSFARKLVSHTNRLEYITTKDQITSTVTLIIEDKKFNI